MEQAYYDEYTGKDKKKIEIYFAGFYGKYNDYYVVQLYYTIPNICGEQAYRETYKIGPATFHRYSSLEVYKE